MKASRVLISCVLVLCGCVLAAGQSGNGSGNGSVSGSGGNVTGPSLPRVTTPYKMLKQPKAKYTRVARKAGVEGSVILKITLLASGQIGSVTYVPKEGADAVEKYGLVDRAIEAAKKIKFKPKTVNGVPMSVIITREYVFTIY